ncbi:MAG: prepilin-type N-terminal cleavage/methylation domain-containing protein, partial [Candidatus Paceibacterota bacterium]
MIKKGFTLIEVLVGVFLLVLIFMGIFGAYRLIGKVLQRSEKKITASAIANEQMERIRNLPYLKVGTQDAELPYAQGVLPQSTSTVRNNLTYNIEIKVKLMTDEADGLDESECDWDYKRAQVSVGWGDDDVELITDIAPTDQTEEIAVCQEQPGGILSVSAFDAAGSLVSSPLIEIYDAETNELVDSYQPSNGKHDFPLATSTYKVIVSKDEFSTSSTYGSDEIANPEKPNPVILEGEVTNLGFSIDEVSTLLVDTLSTWSIETWEDSFADESKISEINGLEVKDGQVEPTATSGYLFSVGINPDSLKKWDELSWSDSETIGKFSYQLYWATSTDWYLVPDSDLDGNSEGFNTSPVDISSLDVNEYPKLKLKGNASTTSTSSPVLKDWQLSWKT